MSFLESIIYGFLSGFSEFSPVSCEAHQFILKYIFGTEGPVPLFDIFTHLGMLAALFFSCRTLFLRINRDKIIMQRGRRRNAPRQIPLGIYDIRVVRTASIPMFLLLICGSIFLKNIPSLTVISILLAVNGVFLILSDYVHHGNKDARSFSALDSIGLGLLSGLSALPGISRIGTSLSYSVCRGADRSAAYEWALLMSTPVIVFLLITDVIGIAASGLGTINFIQILYGALSFLSSFLGGCAAIAFIKYLTEASANTGLSGFAFYSWGAALFSFILYLLT